MHSAITLQDVLNALENHEIKAYYQPQYDCLTNKMKAAEALARWVRPDGTVLLPGAFVPLLEQTDAVCQLDWYMLREVCAFQRDNNLPKKRIIAVNFSRWHLTDPDFLQKLCAIADEYGVEYRYIGV